MKPMQHIATVLGPALAIGACADLLGLDVPVRKADQADGGLDDAHEADAATKPRAPCSAIDTTEDIACTMQGCSATQQRTCLREGYTDYGACACSGWRELAAAPATFRGRREAVAVWTGEEVLIWGGFGAEGQGNAEILGDGAAYAPATNTWRLLNPAPIKARFRSASAWTGVELILWGGVTDLSNRVLANDGAAYNPISDSWRLLPQCPIAERSDPFSAFDVASNSVVIWGGEFERGSYARDGVLYRLETGRFEPTVAPPASFAARTPLAALAAGSMVILGVDRTDTCTDLISYTPSSQKWNKPAAPAAAFAARGQLQAVSCGPHGRDALFWGGSAAGKDQMDGMRFSSGTWSPIGAPDPSLLPNAFYTLFCLTEQPGLLAGLDDQFHYQSVKAALFNGTTWTALPSSAPANRTIPMVVPMGRELFVWGGFDLSMSNGSDTYLRDGKILRLAPP